MWENLKIYCILIKVRYCTVFLLKVIALLCYTARTRACQSVVVLSAAQTMRLKLLLVM